MPETALARRADVAVGMLGPDDPQAMLAKATRYADALAQLIKERNMSLRIQGRDFLLIQAWLFLGSPFGVTARIDGWPRPLLADGKITGWEARAVALRPDGQEIGAATAMCLRAERSGDKQPFLNSPEDHIRARAELRARRRALSSVLGWIPPLAGLDISDPEAPSTRKQWTALHTIAEAHGWDLDERHRRAGMSSFKELTRAEADELMNEWNDLPTASSPPRAGTREQGEGGEPSGETAPFASPFGAGDPAASPSQQEQSPPSFLTGLATEEQWHRAADLFGSRVKVKAAWGKAHPGQSVPDEISAQDMNDLILARLS